jgi:hypothetical protein
MMGLCSGEWKLVRNLVGWIEATRRSNPFCLGGIGEGPRMVLPISLEFHSNNRGAGSGQQEG